ncbi:uncharacterized protein LOC129775699 [Toxorhynchites rutilus septentrionalis]|uniref:uncharacterized protein LOC129775699 n=1 Tax=Toxorhynchites rutilus septentrionalis TaxID=329112 RepID=UPI0024793F6D|nr:uncharacterized protein LOC129775699 [Toxorhynchites rutilus septentrionalis]
MEDLCKRKCGACALADDPDVEMISCRKCDVPFHPKCTNVPPGVSISKWKCYTCSTGLLLPSDTVSVATDATKKKSSKIKPDDIFEKPNTRSKATAILGGTKKNEPTSEKGADGRTTPKRSPGVPKPNTFDKMSIKSNISSARARAQLALQRLEAEQRLEKQKLKEERRQLEEEKAMRKKEQALRKKELDLLERSLNEKYNLEEQIAEEGGSFKGSAMSLAGDWRKTKDWLDKQPDTKAKRYFEKTVAEENAAYEDSEDETIADEEKTEDGSWVPSEIESDVASSVGEPDIQPHQEERRRNPRSFHPENPQHAVRHTTHGVGPSSNQLAARQIWPKKLPIFSGDPEEWPMFNSSFETGNTACGFTEVENLIRLRESLQGQAREAVVTKLMFPHCVPQIMETLRRLYGRPELLVRYLLGKVRQLEAPKPERLDTIMNFGMAVQQLCDHLEAANLRGHLSNPTLLEELIEKLPASIKLDWVRYKRKFVEPSLKEFGRFMERLVEDASEVTSIVKPKQCNKAEKGRPKEKGHCNTHTDESKSSESSKTRTPCPICGKDDHRVRNCEKFEQMSLDTRMQAVKQHKLCETCLYGHGTWRCRSRIHCNIGSCGKRHHPLLHEATVVATRVVPSDCHTHGYGRRSILFRVVPVTLFNGNRRLNTYAFFDEGSSLTLIESGITNSLGVEGTPEPLQLKWTTSVVRNENSSKRVNIQIAGRDLRNRYTLKAAHTVDELKLPGQSLSVDELTARYEHLRNVPVQSYSEAVPRVLVGLDNIDLFAPLECQKGQSGDPIAVRSLLGWAIYGPSETNTSMEKFLNVHSCECKTDTKLNEMIRQQFVLDEAIAPGFALPESAENKRARELLEKTTVWQDGRYETSLLWKTDDVNLPNSLPMATRRLKCLEAKLSKDPELRENVHQQIQEYVRKEYTHKASTQELNEADSRRVWYLPLNVVLHPRKPGKKRLVWDAAAQVEGVSLNSQLLKGPDQLVSLPSVICKFRERQIGFGGDIREMFHQIRIRSVDKHSQRFLFRFDTTLPPDVYLMDVATFGATCSPCSAQYVLRKNADRFAEEYPDAVAAVKSKMYMDDYYDSTDTAEEAGERALQVKNIHLSAGFDMRNWVSNSSDVLLRLGEPVAQTPREFGCEEEIKWKQVLGITWDPIRDVLSFSTNLRAELIPYVIGKQRPTKRMALRIIMSLFDPLGLLAPFTIHGRMLVQDLWRSGLQWDEEMRNEDFEKWVRWTNLFPNISELQIPRCYFNGARPTTYKKVQLHVFTDASDRGYGCAAYFRCEDGEEVRCALVMSKAKVTPLKHLSIPRMELEGAVLGARLL